MEYNTHSDGMHNMHMVKQLCHITSTLKDDRSTTVSAIIIFVDVKTQQIYTLLQQRGKHPEFPGKDTLSFICGATKVGWTSTYDAINAAYLEAFEEAGLDIRNIKSTMVNIFNKPDGRKHYDYIFIMSGEKFPKLKGPQQDYEWEVGIAPNNYIYADPNRTHVWVKSDDLLNLINNQGSFYKSQIKSAGIIINLMTELDSILKINNALM